VSSLYLNSLTADQRQELERTLHEQQQGRCFICEVPVDLELHAGSIDIDHVEPTQTGGKDDPNNFALTHASCNRSKQASNLRVARVLSRFARISDEVKTENRSPNLSDVLKKYGGAKHNLSFRQEDHSVVMTFEEMGDPSLVTVPLYRDEQSGLLYFFALLPIEYLYHDDIINPRAIGSNLRGLVEEFFKKRPQLHVALAWTDLQKDQTKAPIRVFDGQHKAAAQVLLSTKRLPVRVFLNPDRDVLLTTNTNAGTVLRQVAFDLSVRRHLGSALLQDRISRYRRDLNLLPDDVCFSEKDLVNHFKGEWREMRRYILDGVRDGITHSPENKLRGFTDFGGKAKELPFSYSTIEKTFYSFFIFPDVLETPLSFMYEEGENPRQLEQDQIIRLMNLVADLVYVGRFDPQLGTARLENKIQKGDDVPEEHLKAYRLAKEEICHTWLQCVGQIVQSYFVTTTGKLLDQRRLFQHPFPEQLWVNIGNFVANLAAMPLWVNHELSLSVFGGKQNYQYWENIFNNGKTPQGQQVMVKPVNIIEMIEESEQVPVG
jgi:HNH endonuclease